LDASRANGEEIENKFREKLEFLRNDWNGEKRETFRCRQAAFSGTSIAFNQITYICVA
jgi:hypothetical protein